jgi:hypothetical protein
MSYDAWKLADGDARGAQDDRPERCEACVNRDHDRCEARACQCECLGEHDTKSLARWLLMLVLVLCCCRQLGGGTCCAEVDVCSIMLPGCACVPGVEACS